MIGLTGKSGKICEHVSELVSHKNSVTCDISNLKTNINNHQEKIEADSILIAKLDEQINDLQNQIIELREQINNSINADQIDELITDIRTSFELYINSTPRQDNEKLTFLEQQITNLQTQFIDLGLGSDEVQIIKNKSKSIPKLNIVKKQK